MFTTDPASQEFFTKFKDVKDFKELVENPHMKDISSKVVTAINTLVENINNTETVTSAFNTLGNHHIKHNVDPKYFKVVTDGMVPLLGEQFSEVMTSEVTQAWRNFLAAVCTNVNGVYKEVGWKGN